MLRIFRQYYPIRNVFFVMGEFLVVYLSALFANYVILHNTPLINNWYLHLRIFLIAFICQACLYYNDLYDLQVTDTFTELSIRLLQALGATAIILAGIYTIVPKASMGLRVFVVSIGFDIVFIVSWRFGYAVLLSKKMFDQKIALMGSGQLARNILKEITIRKDCGYIGSGVILEGKDIEDAKMRRLLTAQQGGGIVLGYIDQDDLCDIMQQNNILKIVVALSEESRLDLPTNELLRCRVNGIEILEGPSFYEMLTGKLDVDHIKPEWLIFSEGFRKSKTKRFVKRTIDLALSIVMLLMLLPLILIVSLLIKLDNKAPEASHSELWKHFCRLCRLEGILPSERISEMISPKEGARKLSANNLWKEYRKRCELERIDASIKLREMIDHYIKEQELRKTAARPVFFSQERMGKDGKIYRIHKFRSMIVDAERFSGPVWAGENDRRITRIGNFIRKWRIDEIPQLWNVLKGEMSFVGPRPERAHFVNQLETLIPFYRERLTVKPGITGWAQVSYGYGASEDDAKEKLNYDLFYIKNMSIPMDLMIVLKTVKIVIFGKGR